MRSVTHQSHLPRHHHLLGAEKSVNNLHYQVIMLLYLFSGLLLGAAAKSVALYRRECSFSVTASAGDTCTSLASDWGITEDQFISYNIAVGPGCANGVVPGTAYCVEWDGSLPAPAPSTSLTTLTTRTSSTPTTAAPTGPSPTQTGVVSDCKAFYKVVSGDTCQKIISLFGTFTLDDFYTWNPAVRNDCSSLFLGYYYCVGIPSTPTSKPAPTQPITTAGPSPTQSGIISTCTTYHKVASGDTCQTIVDLFSTFTLDDFYTWNPAVGSDCSSLFLGYYVCVGVPGTPTSKPTTSVPTKTSPPAGPTPTQSGIISSCNLYYKVVSGDTCLKIVAQYSGLTLDTFYSWNPAVGKDCSSLFLGYYVCVGVH